MMIMMPDEDQSKDNNDYQMIIMMGLAMHVDCVYSD